FLWLAFVAVIGLWPRAGASGQAIEEPLRATAPPAVGEAAKSVGSAAAESSPLDTFLLRDNKGNLVPVLGMSFEEFEQVLRSKKGVSSATTPAYTMETLAITGTADERTADLELSLSVRVREADWVRIPLLMASAVVRDAPQYRGSGEFFLDHDAKLGGYVAWL